MDSLPKDLHRFLISTPSYFTDTYESVRRGEGLGTQPALPPLYHGGGTWFGWRKRLLARSVSWFRNPTIPYRLRLSTSQDAQHHDLRAGSRV